MEEFDLETLLEEANESLDIAQNIETTESTSAEEPIVENDVVARFQGAPWFKEMQKCACYIGGCGGIGSHLVFQLSRMHPYAINIWDDDRVEAVNMAGQFFSNKELHYYKSVAAQIMADTFSDYQTINAFTSKITASSYMNLPIKNTFTEAPYAIFFSCFDNMEARKVLFDRWYQYATTGGASESVFIDGRLGFDTLQVFFITLENAQTYKDRYLFSDKEADATVCSMKQTTFMAAMIASIMINTLIVYLTNKAIKDEDLKVDVPFFTEYDSTLMFFKTVYK